ncbi:tetratricopeptide repeat-containing sensor histidine kinase [Yeosuana marina]|uniref:tetratricopeptide repeat-containing sensor histidine kinase n=1 Tax=Yeosuana marina TaxID=1565536 RepID=UPI0030EF0095|tara:strand:- start:789 stop:2573 length:1785 start_codon:yes stop_codon:yes gene_type:complete
MKKIKLFIFLLIFSLKGFSQEQQLDSLLHKLSLHTKKDSTKVHLLVNTAWNMIYTNPKKGIDYVEEAIDIANKIKWQKGKALALRQKGNLYYVMANNIQALDAYQKAMKISINLKDKILEASLFSNIGNIYADLKEYDKALEKYQSFLSTSEELGQKTNQIKGLTNIGIVYNDMGKHNQGIHYLLEALSLANEEKNDFFIAAIINNLGLAYKGLKDYKKSLDYYLEASQMAEHLDNKYLEASALNSIGKVNILLKNYDVAGINGKRALALAKEVDAVEWQADSWNVLSTVYEHQGDTQKALLAYKNYIQLKDSILSEEKKVELTRKEMQFQLEKQETLSKAEIKRQRIIKNNTIAGGVLLVLATLIGYILYKMRRDAIDEKKIANFNAKVAETELKALRSQMNPHFIFNSLNSISDYMSKHDIDTANEYLLKFSKLTRSILENSEKKWISLEDDLQLMELYIQIETLRLKNKLSYNIKIDKNIDTENTLVPPLILQPFIENSIWHGIERKKSKGHILIDIKKENQMIVCIVEDDGIGRKKTINIKSENTSMGVKITKSRLDIINKQKKTNGSIVMIDKTQGLRVELKLPFELRF